MSRRTSKAYAELSGGGYHEDDGDEGVHVLPSPTQQLVGEFKLLTKDLLSSGSITEGDLLELTGGYQEKIEKVLALSFEYQSLIERLREAEVISRQDVLELEGTTREKINTLLALEHVRTHEEFYRVGLE